MTEVELDGLSGRELDVLLETKIMGRKVKLADGEPCVWGPDGRVVMKGLPDFVLEDYSLERDGKPSENFNPKRVFEYSNYDLGIARIMDRLVAAPGIQEVTLSWNMADPGWVATVKWLEGEVLRQVKGRDGKYARLAVYRGALKAVLT